MRPADGPSNGSATLSRIQSLADYTTAMLESNFRKRQPRTQCTRGGAIRSAQQLIVTSAPRTSNIVRSRGHEHADAPHPLALLRAGRERVGRCRDAEQRYELAPSHALP